MFLGSKQGTIRSMQLISTDEEDAFGVTPLHVSDHHSETLAMGLSSSDCSLPLREELEGTATTAGRTLPRGSSSCSRRN